MSTTTTAPKPIRVRAPNGCLKYEGFVLDPQALRRYLIRSTQELEEAARTLETRVENGTRSLCVVHAELTVCQKVLDAKNGSPADFDALLALAHPSKSKAASQAQSKAAPRVRTAEQKARDAEGRRKRASMVKALLASAPPPPSADSASCDDDAPPAPKKARPAKKAAPKKKNSFIDDEDDAPKRKRDGGAGKALAK